MTSPRTFGWASASAQRCSLPARTSPPRTSSGSVVAAATARMSSVAGIFSHVYALVDPRPDATWIERTTASVDRSLRSPSLVRSLKNGSTIAILACAAIGCVTGHPVVQLERGSGDAAAVHRAEDVLPLERTEHRQVLDDVRRTEEAVHARLAQCLDQSSQHVPAVSHGVVPAPCGKHPARRVVGGHDEQGFGRRVRPTPFPYRLQQPLGRGPADLVEIGDVDHGSSVQRAPPRTSVWPASSTRSMSSAVGIAVEHSSRDATMAPAALARRTVVSRSRPWSSPSMSEPPKASPAPRPLYGVVGVGGTTMRSSRVFASVPRGPCLTIAICTPRSRSASAARSGSVSPTATSHSARFPTATVDRARHQSYRCLASSVEVQNMGRQSRSKTV